MTKTTRPTRIRTHYEEIEDGRWVLVPGEPTRVQIVAGWIVWHCRELTGVLVPAGLAVTVTPWAWLASGAVAAGWTVYEVWRAREQAAIKAGRDLLVPAVIDLEEEAAPSAESDVDTVRDGETTDARPPATVTAPADGVEVWL